jgi:hypothetical protein
VDPAANTKHVKFNDLVSPVRNGAENPFAERYIGINDFWPNLNNRKENIRFEPGNVINLCDSV